MINKNDMKQRMTRVKYWFEENVLGKICNTIIFLFVSTLVFVGLITIAIILIEQKSINNKKEVIAYFCDNLFTAINAWYPEIPEGEGLITWKSYIFKVMIALFGIFLTSIIIGFVSEKISKMFENIRNSNRKVIEKNHIVILGYTFGDCKIIEEVIKSTLKKITIVVAECCNKTEVYDDIINQIDIPKNVKLIVQSIDITDYKVLEFCSIEKSKIVIVNSLKDDRTMKIVLAVSHIIDKYKSKNVKIISAIRNNENILPYNKQANIITMISAQNFIARLLAQTINQKLIYNVLLQLFSFEGVEFYVNKIPELVGKNFEYLIKNFSSAIPIGIINNDKFSLFTDLNYVIKNEDSIVYIANEIQSYRIMECKNADVNGDIFNCFNNTMARKKVLIIGYCNSYKILLNETCVDEIFVIGKSEKEQNIISKEIEGMYHIEKLDLVSLNRQNLEDLVLDDRYDEIVLLPDINLENKKEDIKTMLLALHLRDIRRLNNLKYHIIVSLNDDKNRELLDIDEFQTIVVSDNVVNMFLVQMAFNNNLKPLYLDLLSKDGANIDIVDVNGQMCKLEKINIGTLRRILVVKNHYIYIGHVNKTSGKVVFDLDINGELVLDKNLALLVVNS